MRLFNIDHKTMVKLLVKKRWRKPKRFASLFAYIAPVVWLYNRFIEFYNDSLYYLAHTSQLVYIQAVLNDRWDSGLRRIRIIDAPLKVPLYAYKSVEGKPIYIKKTSENDPVWLRKKIENFPNGPQFIIEVPVFITFDTAEMVALVKKYCLPGRVFIIQQV